MLITLKRDGVCADCGSEVPAGSKARWYKNGTIYGLTCHEQIKPEKKAAPKKAAQSKAAERLTASRKKAAKKRSKKRAARRVIPQTNGDGEVNWLAL
jgi:hypothetical protein